MAKEHRSEPPAREMNNGVSVIGPGMEIVGAIKSDGSVRVEGRVKGRIEAAASVFVGREGTLEGDIETRDAVIAGRVQGTVIGESRVELQETCHVEGPIHSPSIKLDEGGHIEGRVHMGHLRGGRQGTGGPKKRRQEPPKADRLRGSTSPPAASDK